MDAPPPARIWLFLTVVTGLLIGSGAVFFSATVDNPIKSLFGQLLTVQVIICIVVWSLLALASRWLLVGRLPKLPLSFAPTIIWGGFRVGLLVAAVAVIIGWLTALALRLPLATTFIRALFLLVLFTGVTGILGAVINSILAIQELRKRSTE